MTTKEKSPIFLSLPFTESDNYSQKILSGLGKATRRGIKKCFNCGVYNGTRSSMCKNKECGVVLKDSEEKSKADLDAIRLLTGTERQVYSVRVKDTGVNSRGFVQLPLLQNNEKEANIFSEVALCFVDSCQNSFDNSILKCHEENQNDNNLLCKHIKSALKSQRAAVPVDLKNHVLHILKVSEDVKAKLYLLATEKEGALVQRVSKTVMAVKCQVTPKHPLGYLHFTFIKRKDGYEKYYCSCTELIGFGLEQDIPNNIRYKCVHYYACIWALASDSRYLDEFSNFVNNELPRTQKVTPTIINLTSSVNVQEKKKNAMNSVGQNTTNTGKLVGQKRKFKKLKNSYTLKRCKRLMPKILPVEIKVLSVPKESTDVSWAFVDWVTYVTESINRTMQFDNCGILNTLVFNIPENFYQCFKTRIPSIYEEIQTGVSFTYHIMNILHLKEIFDTPQIKLKISKKFVHNEHKGYIEYDENEENSACYQCSFIFFLNVGQSTVDESDNTNNSFAIEWLPPFSNLTKIGQLKLQYKYGRKST